MFFWRERKARISGFPDGLVKLVFRASDKALLGVHIVGEVAREPIHIGQFVIQMGGTIDRLIDATFAVPTRSEDLQYAAYDGLMRLSPAALGWARSRSFRACPKRTPRKYGHVQRGDATLRVLPMQGRALPSRPDNQRPAGWL